MKTYKTVDPATGKLIKTYKTLATDEIDDKIHQAQKAFLTISSLDFKKRSQALHLVADDLQSNSSRLAKIMALEMGKPFEQGRLEINKCAETFVYFADHADAMLKDILVDRPNGKARIVHEPVGIIFAVSPWNFPFWQIVRVAAPGLAAGNAILFKPASNVPECALALEDIINRAFNFSALTAIFIDTDDTEKVIADARVRMVTLTGGERAGSAVSMLAGKHLKKSVLELGGSDPFIILDDVDMKLAVKNAVDARLLNNGQSCICAKRFIVHEKIFDRFLREFVDEMKKILPGDPSEPSTKLGPLANREQRELLQAQVDDAKNKGAEILCGGNVIAGDGNFYPASVIKGITSSMRVYHEEVFGPVALVFSCIDDDDALWLANDTNFGLGASVWTTNKTRAQFFAHRLEAGTVAINEMVRSDFRLPFGGKKISGFGRELGEEGLLEYTSSKTVLGEVSR